MNFLTRSAKQTSSLGESIAQSLTGGEIIALIGGLGAGKTAFTKGLARGLGITGTVSSPTFAILNIYEGRLRLCHYDAYRLSGAAEAMDIGLDEYFGQKDCVCVIEWADNLGGLLKNHAVKTIKIKTKSKNTREITIDDK